MERERVAELCGSHSPEILRAEGISPGEALDSGGGERTVPRLHTADSGAMGRLALTWGCGKHREG